jgi:uncharacterized protein YjiS (DUF1127 family)
MSSPFRPAAQASAILIAALRAGARAVLAFEAWLDARMNRQIVKELYAQDDRMLKDIGLTRADVFAALLAPVSEDPTRILATRSNEAKAASHALAKESLEQTSVQPECLKQESVKQECLSLAPFSGKSAIAA